MEEKENVRITFSFSYPGKTNEVEQQLQKLREMVVKAGGSQKMSRLLTQSPKREVYLEAD